MALDPSRDDTRLPAALLVLVTAGFGSLLVYAMPSVFIGLVSLIGCVYIYVWHMLYGRTLSRQPRVIFDEVNVLKSYQPRARSMGHLFEPELPTPVPNGGMINNSVDEDNFRKKRDAHYEGEYLKITKLNKESEKLPLKTPNGSTASPQQQFFGDDLDDHTESGEI